MSAKTVVALAALASSSAACKWTTFDELESDAWVLSIERPASDASNWAVAVQNMQSSGAGGRLAVIGASEALYQELVLSSTGDAEVSDAEVNLNDEYGLVTLEPNPPLLDDPETDGVALVTRSGGAIVIVLREGDNIDPYQIFGKDRPDAATYMVPPRRDDVTAALPAHVIVAQDDVLIGAHNKDDAHPMNGVLPRCALVDDATPTQTVQVRALGAFRPAGQMYDDILVWSSAGKLLRYDGGIYNGEAQLPANHCAAGEKPRAGVASIETGFNPIAGSQILTFTTDTGRYAVLQGHDEANRGFLAMYDLDAFALVGTARSDERLRTAALIEIEGTHHVIAGYPSVTHDGVTAGQVQVFELDPASGISASSVLTLHDSQPEDDQAFGRSVAAITFNDQPVIVVAADNELFVYYRTTLYGETRSK